MALSNARARQIGRQMAQGGGAGAQNPNIGDITLSAATVEGGSAAHTVIGNVACTNSLSVVTLVDAAGAQVELVGAVLKAGATATDFDALPSFYITLRATLGVRHVDKNFTITVTDPG